MAGQGSRFTKAGISTPKPLIEVDGITLAEHSIKTLGIDGKFIFITRSFDDPKDKERLTDIFVKTCKSFIEVRVDGEHLGAAHSAMYAEHYVDPNEPLIVTNCDQHLNWDGKAFENFISSNERYVKFTNREEEIIDGAIVLYESDNPKNSFAILDGINVVAVAEKQPISNKALVGVHYWSEARDFFDSARELLRDYKIAGYPECYVSVTYNYLIKKNKFIAAYFIEDAGFIPLGTPEDVEEYEQGIG